MSNVSDPPSLPRACYKPTRLLPPSCVPSETVACMTGRRHSRRPTPLNAVGPHPYWGGRPQALHVSIETKRRKVFDPLVAAGADINGHNDQYEHWSPLMLTFHRDQTGMRQALMEWNARVG